MDFFDHLALGFGVALTPANLAFAFVGAMVGTLIGVLPGIGPIATIAMLLPLTFHLEPVSRPDHAGRHLLRRAVWRLDHGDPGQPAGRNLVGRDLPRRPPDGAAGPRRRGACRRGAGSFFAGTIATFLIAGFAPPLSRIGQSFGAPEYFSLMLLGLVAAVVLAHGSVLKAIAMIVLGLLIGLVGTDGNTGGNASPSASAS